MKIFLGTVVKLNNETDYKRNTCTIAVHEKQGTGKYIMSEKLHSHWLNQTNPPKDRGKRGKSKKRFKGN